MQVTVPVLEAEIARRELQLEAAALSCFIDLLDEEQCALKENRIDAVSGLTAEKARQLGALARHAAQREARLKSEGCTTDAAGMRAWLDARAGIPGLASAWTLVAQLAGEAREKNEVNGWLVSIQMQHTGRQLAFLAKMASNEPTYSADGVEHATMRQRSLGEA